jgi:hypothetical protein
MNKGSGRKSMMIKEKMKNYRRLRNELERTMEKAKKESR